MRRYRIMSLMLLIVSAVAFIAFRMYSNVIVDNVPPVVTCTTPELRVPVNATETDLLKGVSAEDRRSGDVSDTLVVESLSAFTKEGTRIAVYAAVDESKNVGRCEREIIYEGYTKPVFKMSDDLCFVEGKAIDFFNGISAHSDMDGDLTANIKYSVDEIVDTMQTGSYPIEYRVMDSGGKTVYLDTEIEIYDKEYEGISVYLSEYLTYVKKGEEFNSRDFYVGASIEGDLQVKSTVDLEQEGVYYSDFIVSGSGLKGKARLIVVVE